MDVIPLSSLPRGRRARISAIEGGEAFARKLLEMGVEEGQEVAIMHKGPLGGDPLAIRMHDRTIALRRRDASHIAVELLA
jgi:ferrous iron transport protein A